MLLVESMNFVVDRDARVAKRRNEGKQIEGAGIGFVGGHPTAADHIAAVRRACAIEAAAEQGCLLEDMNILAFESAISDQIGCACERRYAAADEVGLDMAWLTAAHRTLQSIGWLRWIVRRLAANSLRRGDGAAPVAWQGVAE